MDTDAKPKRPNKRKLQGLINRCGKASDAFHRAERELAAYTTEIYGCTWADIDADQIIDGVTGGCGLSSNLTAAEFDTEMRQCIEAKYNS